MVCPVRFLILFVNVVFFGKCSTSGFVSCIFAAIAAADIAAVVVISVLGSSHSTILSFAGLRAGAGSCASTGHCTAAIVVIGILGGSHRAILRFAGLCAGLCAGAGSCTVVRSSAHSGSCTAVKIILGSKRTCLLAVFLLYAIE